MPDVRGPIGRIEPGLLITVVVAAALAWIAYDNASYSLSSRATLAIVVWWVVLLVLAFNLPTPTRVPRATLVAGGLLAGFACWTLASALWAPSVEDAVNEFNRVSLYLGLYLLVVVAASARHVGRWADALALAVTATAIVALVSRLFPDSFGDREFAVFLPGVVTRLSFPLGYWNGLAIFAALGVPLLLRVALVARTNLVRGLALAPIPVIGSVIFLASSRGGVVTALAGTLAFVLLTERRWSAVAAIAIAGAATGAAIAVLLARDELVDGPLGTETARDQGRTAAFLIVLACLAAALAYSLGARFLGGRIRPSRRTGQIAAGLAVLALLAGIVASDPVDRFETFKTPPRELEALDPGDFVTAHLLSGSGSGRWQHWSVRGRPIAGVRTPRRRRGLVRVVVGAARLHPPVRAGRALAVPRDARRARSRRPRPRSSPSFSPALSSARDARSRSTGDGRVTLASLTAVFVAYAVAAGFDWVWELTAVSALGVVALALVTGPATEVYEPLRSARPGESARWTSRHRVALGVVTGVVAWLMIVAQAIPLVADREIARSEAAVAERDLDEALEAADASRDIQPWAATPYLQLALVSEVRGELRRARAWIDEAIERDDRNWRLWLVSARLETKLGNVAAANRSLRRAVELNPRSPLFENLLDNA